MEKNAQNACQIQKLYILNAKTNAFIKAENDSARSYFLNHSLNVETQNWTHASKLCRTVLGSLQYTVIKVL